MDIGAGCALRGKPTALIHGGGRGGGEIGAAGARQ